MGPFDQACKTDVESSGAGRPNNDPVSKELQEKSMTNCKETSKPHQHGGSS